MAHTAMTNDRDPARRWLCSMLVVALAIGCGARPEAAPPPRTDPRVRVVRPERRTIERTVGQPAFINAYEQTAMYPKVAGYIKKWTVDIGDRIAKDQVMADLFVPELDAEYAQKKALVAQHLVSIEAAKQYVKVAQNTLHVAVAQVKKAEADVGSYESAVERWESEVKRLTGLVAQQVVDKQVLDESQKQLKSNIAQRDAALAGVAAAQADEMARQADLDKAIVDVGVAEAKATVSRAEEQRYAALRELYQAHGSLRRRCGGAQCEHGRFCAAGRRGQIGRARSRGRVGRARRSDLHRRQNGHRARFYRCT